MFATWVGIDAKTIERVAAVGEGELRSASELISEDQQVTYGMWMH